MTQPDTHDADLFAIHPNDSNLGGDDSLVQAKLFFRSDTSVLQMRLNSEAAARDICG